MKRILMIAAAAAALAACTDEAVTDVETGRAETGVQMHGAASALDARANALSGIDDALDRIIPALTNETTAQPLTAALSGLRTALADAAATGVPPLIDAASAAVERHARTGLDAADLDAIRLALEYVRNAAAA